MSATEYGTEKNMEEPKHFSKSNSDAESVRETSGEGLGTGEGKLVRQLKNRHIAMIRWARLLANLSFHILIIALVLVGLLELVCNFSYR